MQGDPASAQADDFKMVSPGLSPCLSPKSMVSSPLLDPYDDVQMDVDIGTIPEEVLFGWHKSPLSKSAQKGKSREISSSARSSMDDPISPMALPARRSAVEIGKGKGKELPSPVTAVSPLALSPTISSAMNTRGRPEGELLS
jgi:hypothetical protein